MSNSCARCGERLYAGGWGSRIGQVCIRCSYEMRDEEQKRYEREQVLHAARAIVALSEERA